MASLKEQIQKADKCIYVDGTRSYDAIFMRWVPQLPAVTVAVLEDRLAAYWEGAHGQSVLSYLLRSQLDRTVSTLNEPVESGDEEGECYVRITAMPNALRKALETPKGREWAGLASPNGSEDEYEESSSSSKEPPTPLPPIQKRKRPDVAVAKARPS